MDHFGEVYDSIQDENFCKNKHQIYSSAITQMADAWIPLILAIYFWHLTKDWIYFYYFSLSIWVIAWILWLFIPESPRWLVSKQRSDEAKTILNKIAKINSKDQISPEKIIIDDKIYIMSKNIKIEIDNTITMFYYKLWILMN